MHSFVYGIMSLVWLSSSGGGAELAPPVNLTLITLNTHFNLSWSQGWSQGARHRGANVSFSVQYVPSFKLLNPGTQWVTACENTAHTWCDLTPRKLYFQAIYTLRVRARRGPLRSGWVLREFCADKEAALGPPSRVDLAPAGALLDVTIWDPRSSSNGSMKELYPRMYYRVVYWEHSATRSPDTVVVDTPVNTVTLPDLRAWTWYCVSVQSRYDFYSKTSAFTTPHCMQTEGAVPWWQILLVFSLSGLGGFVGLLVLLYSGLCCYRTAKDTLFPAVTLPPHFQAYLMDLSPGSDAPRLLTPDSESELTCDRLSICPQVVPLEVHLPPLSASTAPPSGLEADARHNRQDSGGSGDSGVYSTEGGSGPPRHCSHDLPSLGTQEPWDGGSAALLQPLSLEQVSLEQVSLEQVSLEQLSLEQVSLEQVSLEQVSLEQVSLEQVSLEPRGLKAEAAGPWGVRDEGIMDMGV